MEINKKLNLVIPLEREDGSSIYVYSIPVAKATFEQFYRVFASAFSAIYGGGLGIMTGPRVAAMILKDAAKDLGMWDGPEGAEQGLMNEMRRLTNVFAITEKGWEAIPFHEAIARKMIDEDDASEVENALAFFTLASHMHRKKDKLGILEGASKLWGGHLESSSYTEFYASLPTSTAGAISQKALASAMPKVSTGNAVSNSDLGIIQIPT